MFGEEINRCLFPKDLHGNNISTVECTFHITLDVQNLKTFYVIFTEILIILFHFSLCE